jgi:soluble lytic murein transglycosylase-like protein
MIDMIVFSCRRFTPVILFVFTAVCFYSSPAAASLNKYMAKHRGIEVSREQHKRLADYDKLIKHFCSFSFFEPRHKVNPDFIRALILAESNCKSRALSCKNARGLTQIIYTTGKQAARELVRKDFDYKYVSKEQLQHLQPEDLYKPEVNILLACYLVAKYNYQNHGKLDLVVSAWNAGEYSITDNKPAQYKETLNHIGKVNGYFLYLLKNKESVN